MSEIPECPHTDFIITKAGAFTPEAIERLVAERDALLGVLKSPRIVGHIVIVTDEPIPGVPSRRAYLFETPDAAVRGVREAQSYGLNADGAPLRRGDILPEEWAHSKEPPAPDVWWDDEGCWRQIDGVTLGPFPSEEQAEAATLPGKS